MIKYVINKQYDGNSYCIPAHNSVTSNPTLVVGYSDEELKNVLKKALHTIQTQYNPEQEEAERQRLHEWNMKQMEEWSKTKEQKLEEMLAQTTEHVLSYCFNIDKKRVQR